MGLVTTSHQRITPTQMLGMRLSRLVVTTTTPRARLSISRISLLGPMKTLRTLGISLDLLEVEVTDGEVTPVVLSFFTVVVTRAASTL
jgi:hypothetical protein